MIAASNAIQNAMSNAMKHAIQKAMCISVHSVSSVFMRISLFLCLSLFISVHLCVSLCICEGLEGLFEVDNLDYGVLRSQNCIGSYGRLMGASHVNLVQIRARGSEL